MIIIDPRQRIRVEMPEDGAPAHERAWFEIRPLTVRHETYITSIVQDWITRFGAMDSQEMDAGMRARMVEVMDLRTRFALVGWGNVRDASGKDVPLTREPIEIFGMADEAVAPHLVAALPLDARALIAAATMKAIKVPEEIAQGFK